MISIITVADSSGGGNVRKSIRDNIPEDVHIYSISDQFTPEMKGFGGELDQNLG